MCSRFQARLNQNQNQNRTQTQKKNVSAPVYLVSVFEKEWIQREHELQTEATAKERF
jgi:hypothetical protein